MAITCTEEEKSLLISHRNPEDEEESEDEEEEEETLSLCDLPNEKIQSPRRSKNEEEEEEFEFGIGSSFRVGSDSLEPCPEMSTADELFFKGQILPLRHSVSLDARLSDPTRFITRSESLEYRRTGIEPDRDSTIKNNFIGLSQPSPQPQIRRSSSMTARVNSIRNPKSSSIWDFLRLGLVRTPEIELRTGRVSVSRNSSCSSTSTSSNSKKTGESRSRNRRRTSFLFSDCKCSVATETVMTVRPVTEEKQRKTKKKEEKSAMARTRTFEWLKELSQVGFVADHGRR